MKTKLILFGLTLFATSSTYAQTATDINTQIQTTRDVVAQMTRTLRAGAVDPTLNLADYKAWKSDFDARAGKTMEEFERQMIEVILPMVAESSRAYLKVVNTTQLTEADRAQIQKEEWERLVADRTFQVKYREAVQQVYRGIFGSLPTYGDYYDSRGRFYDSAWTEILSTRYGQMDSFLKGIGHPNNGDELVYIYGYHKLIYPYVRQNCESRLCVSLVSRKLFEAVNLVSANIDITRSIKIGESSLNLEGFMTRNSYHATNLFGKVLENSEWYPAEVKTLPLDTK